MGKCDPSNQQCKFCKNVWGHHWCDITIQALHVTLRRGFAVAVCKHIIHPPKLLTIIVIISLTRMPITASLIYISKTCHSSEDCCKTSCLALQLRATFYSIVLTGMYRNSHYRWRKWVMSIFPPKLYIPTRWSYVNMQCYIKLHQCVVCSFLLLYFIAFERWAVTFRPPRSREETCACCRDGSIDVAQSQHALLWLLASNLISWKKSTTQLAGRLACWLAGWLGWQGVCFVMRRASGK